MTGPSKMNGYRKFAIHTQQGIIQS
jgi:hypothetical protein